MIEMTMNQAKETKNMVRYEEVGASQPINLYLRKTQFSGKPPLTIKVSVTYDAN